MSTVTGYGRPGLLERLTSSTAFAVLFGIAATILAPTLLFGMVFGTAALVFGFHGSDDVAMVLLTIGGFIGVIGLFRSQRSVASPSDYRLTLASLAIGILTAVALAGALVARLGLDDKLSIAGIVLSIPPVLTALGRIARLRRLRAAELGRVRDSLPLIFLAVALAEAACAIAICVQLSFAG